MAKLYKCKLKSKIGCFFDAKLGVYIRPNEEVIVPRVRIPGSRLEKWIRKGSVIAVPIADSVEPVEPEKPKATASAEAAVDDMIANLPSEEEAKTTYIKYSKAELVEKAVSKGMPEDEARKMKKAALLEFVNG